jgi:hypothetical protein
MSAKFVKDLAVIALVAAADHSAKKGFLVKFSSGQAALNDSATVPAFGVILDGEAQGGQDSIGVLGGNLGTVKLKAGGNITLGATLMQKNDGTVVVENTAIARAIVGIALEAAATDELFEAVVISPIKVPAITAAAVVLADATDDATVWALANQLKVELNKLVTDLTAQAAAE